MWRLRWLCQLGGEPQCPLSPSFLSILFSDIKIIFLSGVGWQVEQSIALDRQVIRALGL